MSIIHINELQKRRFITVKKRQKYRRLSLDVCLQIALQVLSGVQVRRVVEPSRSHVHSPLQVLRDSELLSTHHANMAYDELKKLRVLVATGERAGRKHVFQFVPERVQDQNFARGNLSRQYVSRIFRLLDELEQSVLDASFYEELVFSCDDRPKLRGLESLHEAVTQLEIATDQAERVYRALESVLGEVQVIQSRLPSLQKLQEARK